MFILIISKHVLDVRLKKTPEKNRNIEIILPSWERQEKKKNMYCTFQNVGNIVSNHFT